MIFRALYVRGDPYETSDAVFGVKDSLIVDITEVSEEKMASEYGVTLGTKLLTYDFVLITDEESRQLRDKKAIDALAELGRKCKILNGLPVPDVD